MALSTELFDAVEHGYARAAEWQKHEAVWLAWPWDESLWEGNLAGAQREFIDLCTAITARDPQTDQPLGEPIHLLVADASSERQAREALRHIQDNVVYFQFPYGDIWLRDTGPVFLDAAASPAGGKLAVCFSFNGWGGKYLLRRDSEVAQFIVSKSKHPSVDVPFILEGGAIETNGLGACLTTRQCLLNENRNPGHDQRGIESVLKRTLGLHTILWLEQGLSDDHTDGHIDNLARFIAHDTVMCMRPHDNTDPNKAVLVEIEEQLREFSRTGDVIRTIHTVPSPGRVFDHDGNMMPASYMNFYIANASVIVPAFGKDTDEIARQAIATHFPDRQVQSLAASHLLTGGGTFHCISQQQ